MKSNKLKNIFLGVIAINLTLITLIQLNIWPSTANATDFNANYGLVPLNENGSVNVNLVSTNSETIDVNIAKVNGYTVKSYDDGHLGIYNPLLTKISNELIDIEFNTFK